jgi:ribosome-associated translation inhibitor RaiA
MNRIHVVGDALNPQARTYAEYRVFSALTRHARKFRRARVVLRARTQFGTCDTVTCAVSVALEPSGSIRVRATDAHVYAAINRAIERLGDVLGGRIERRRSS